MCLVLCKKWHESVECLCGCEKSEEWKNGQRLTSCSLLTQKSWMVLDTFLAMVMLNLVSTLDTCSSLQKTYSKDPVMNQEGRTHTKWMDDKRRKKCMDDKWRTKWMDDKWQAKWMDDKWPTKGIGWQMTDKTHRRQNAWMTNNRQNAWMTNNRQNAWMSNKWQNAWMSNNRQNARQNAWMTNNRQNAWMTNNRQNAWMIDGNSDAAITEVYCWGENTPVWTSTIPHIIKNHKFFKNIRHRRTFFDLKIKRSKQLLWGLMTCASGRWAGLMASWANGD